MRSVVRGLLLVVAMTLPAHGQRYRVLVGVAGTTKMSLIEFSPCIPAETSACGAWITRVVDTSSDSSFGSLPTVAIEQSARTSSIAIQHGQLSVQTSGKSPGVQPKGVISDPRRNATAVVITGDGRYAFAVFEPKASGEQSMVRMIDFGMKMTIAGIALPDKLAGICLAP